MTHDTKCEYMSLDDKWHGTNSLFIALDTATGRVLDKWFDRHRASEFLSLIKDLEGHVPKNLDVYIIMYNDATHKTEELMKWLF